jgi:hypothetical protein
MGDFMKRPLGILAPVIWVLMPCTVVAERLEEHFLTGNLSGQLAVQKWHQETNDGERGGFANTSLWLDYEHAGASGASVSVGAMVSARLWEENSGDYENQMANDRMLYRATLGYADENGWQLLLGRQTVNLVWLTDFIQGATLGIKGMRGLSAWFAWVDRHAVIELDEVAKQFDSVNNRQGLYAVDVNYLAGDWLTLNPYFYYAPDEWQMQGLVLTASYGLFEHVAATTMLHAVRASPSATFLDGTGERVEDGDLVWMEQNIRHGDLAISAGLVQLMNESDGGLGRFGDQFPLEENRFLLSERAKTGYAGLEYGIDRLALQLLYGQTRYRSGDRRRTGQEWHLMADYALFDNLLLSVSFVASRDKEEGGTDRRLKSALVYRF